jgi:imidazolonepropionase-like amidohydrolase
MSISGYHIPRTMALLVTLLLLWFQQPAAVVAAPTYRLWFIGHDIGFETDTFSRDGQHLDSTFHFEDRGTAIDLTASLDLASGAVTHFLIKGRNYRLFRSDAEVSVSGGRAHIRDLTQERDLEIGGRPFFPVDNYAPVGVQAQLIKYWLRQGRPAAIEAPPAGTVRITSRGKANGLERLSIDGVVWGTEAAWIDPNGELIALTTWAGALPFGAVRTGKEDIFRSLMSEAVHDRIDDLARITSQTPTLADNTFALVGARVITGTSAALVENATIIVRDGHIALVGPSATTPVPRQLRPIDVRGKTIVPGLWDMHAHASQIDWAPVYLAAGVTTIRDMGGEEGFLIAIRDAIRSGKYLGPRYLLAGLVDGPGPRAFGASSAATAEEGRAIVRRYHDEGFEQIKVYLTVPPEVVRAIVEEAHRLKMTVTGHVPNGMTSQSVVETGFDQIAHMQLRGAPDSDASKQQIAFFKAHSTVMDPTASWSELGGRPAATPLDRLLPGISRLPVSLVRMFASMSPGDGAPDAVHARLIDSVRLLKDGIDAGLIVVAGTDKGVPGFSLQRELELYVEGGMTPLEALQTATIMPAQAMKLEKELGTLEVGKRADLVVLDANPLENISNIRTARMVAANGRLYECNTLWRAAQFQPR